MYVHVPVSVWLGVVYHLVVAINELVGWKINASPSVPLRTTDGRRIDIATKSKDLWMMSMCVSCLSSYRS